MNTGNNEINASIDEDSDINFTTDVSEKVTIEMSNDTNKSKMKHKRYCVVNKCHTGHHMDRVENKRLNHRQPTLFSVPRVNTFIYLFISNIHRLYTSP